MEPDPPFVISRQTHLHLIDPFPCCVIALRREAPGKGFLTVIAGRPPRLNGFRARSSALQMTNKCGPCVRANVINDRPSTGHRSRVGGWGVHGG